MKKNLDTRFVRRARDATPCVGTARVSVSESSASVTERARRRTAVASKIVGRNVERACDESNL